MCVFCEKVDAKLNWGGLFFFSFLFFFFNFMQDRNFILVYIYIYIYMCVCLCESPFWRLEPQHLPLVSQELCTCGCGVTVMPRVRMPRVRGG